MLGSDWLTKSCLAQLWAWRRYPGALEFFNLSHVEQRAGTVARDHHTVSRSYVFSRHFLPNSLIVFRCVMKLGRIGIFLLQFAASPICDAGPALLLVLKLSSDSLEEFPADLARQRSSGIGDGAELIVRQSEDHGGISVPRKR